MDSRIKQITALTLCSLALSGCSNRLINPISTTNDFHAERTEKVFYGIPGAFSIEGTVVRLDSNWVITSKHNKLLVDLRGEAHYHPTCDIALYKDPIDEHIEPIEIGTAYVGKTMKATGYPLRYPLTTTEGDFIIDINITQGPWKECKFSGADLGVMNGMSGGGVWESDENRLVGIIHGWSLSKYEQFGKLGLFVPLEPHNDWITEITGINYLAKKKP